MRHLVVLLLWLLSLPASAQLPSPSPSPQSLLASSGESQFLPVDQAFAFNFSQQGNNLKLVWTIADGYYLYKEKFQFVAKGATLGQARLPQGQMHHDDYFGEQEVYRHQVLIQLPISQADDGAVVKIRYQGCADAGLCYPPQTRQLELFAVSARSNASQTTRSPTPASVTEAPTSEQFELLDQLRRQPLWLSLIIFFVLGIGLAFTPCVFPMYPILSGIIAGQKQLSSRQAFVLSLAYVQGMALTYTLLGVIVASAGMKYQAAMQHPYVLIAMSLLFVILALSMFGLFHLQLPQRWQQALGQLSRRQKGGHLASVFAMGALSGLIASPCTTAPLTAILLYIAQSGDTLLGASALYILGLGMGLPLLLLGSSAGKWLPKAGSWMNTVRHLFGFLLLAVAISLLGRFVDSQISLVLWSLLALVSGGYLLQSASRLKQEVWQGLCRTLGVALVALAVVLLIPSERASHSGSPNAAVQNSSPFETVPDLAALQQALAQARRDGLPVLVDLYADWCVSCKEFEQFTFSDPKVRQLLSHGRLLKVDLSAPTDANIALQEHYQVLGLPTLLLFDAQGRELRQQRITGFMDAETFYNHVRQAWQIAP